MYTRSLETIFFAQWYCISVPRVSNSTLFQIRARRQTYVGRNKYTDAIIPPPHILYVSLQLDPLDPDSLPMFLKQPMTLDAELAPNCAVYRELAPLEVMYEVAPEASDMALV